MNSGLKNSTIYDELYTPEIAVKMILPFIPKDVKTIWEPTGTADSQIAIVLKNKYDVITTHISNGEDFFEIDRDADLIVTNPPYSIKDKFLHRLYELDKPFMILLPLTALESKTRSKMFRKQPPQVILPDKRINFSKRNNNIWFQTSWFCYKCKLKNDLNFIDVNEHLSTSDLIEEYFKKNKNKYLDEILADLRQELKIKDRSIKDYLKELGYKPKKRSKTDKVLMNILNSYKSTEKLTVKTIQKKYTQKVMCTKGISKREITERTVFNFLKKYPFYKDIINRINNK